jgi:predicted dehydrogenase
MHTLSFYEPGHFHAALTLRNENPRVANDVHLYAHPGPDRESFLALVDAFNSRPDSPTQWRVSVHEAEDPLTTLIADRRGDIVVLAGRNATKLATIARLHCDGFHVLADKPWLTSSAALPHLREATDGAPLAMDIMTERHEVLARLRQRIVTNSNLFGDFERDAAVPAIEIATVHHLYKVVNGKPLRRPWWYYDVGIQGDGIVDVQSHLADQVQWLVMGEKPAEWSRDVELRAARRWTTPVPLDLYRDSTGQPEFPDALGDYVYGDRLELPCNGEIEFRLNGVGARLRAEWGQREAPGGGDRHPCTVRGTRADIVVRHGPETGPMAELDLLTKPGSGIDEPLAEAVASWQDEFPGLGFRPVNGGFRFTIPDALRTSHESHFAMVLEDFLDYVDAGCWPEWLAPGIRLRYEILAHARELALS